MAERDHHRKKGEEGNEKSIFCVGFSIGVGNANAGNVGRRRQRFGLDRDDRQVLSGGFVPGETPGRKFLQSLWARRNPDCRFFFGDNPETGTDE